MPYIIAFVIIIVAAGALLLFNRPVEAPMTTSTEEALVPIENETMQGVPEGFTSPPTPPPSNNRGGEESMMEMDVEAELESEVVPEAVMNDSQTTTQTYVAEASYFTPRRTEHDMEITFELEGETVRGVNVTYDGGPAATPAHSGFDSAYKAEVIGQNINDIELSRTGGASLTSVAFNEAVAEIRAQL
jgi:hypothetical protein